MEWWLEGEESRKMVEFVLKEKRKAAGTGGVYTSFYVCSRGNSDGKKKNYTKKNPNWTRKVDTKKCDCKARLAIRTYPSTPTVLGKYTDTHNHETGDANAKYTRLSKETQQEIERLLRLGVDPAKVLEQIQGGKVTEETLEELNSSSANRSEFATRADVRRIQKVIEEEMIRLASQDGASVLEWVKNLQGLGHFVELKTSANNPPPDSLLLCLLASGC
ncbi:hypothetical protein PM082_014451 [Marasmius tenuissimus]|nr:hypothetical protein PM082_014451 [Marasmius tenuissimus]